MEEGNVFHFITGGAAEALKLARAAAGDKDIRIGGGAQTIREYLMAGEIDEMHMVVSPVLLGRGEHLMTGLDLPALGYTVGEAVRGEEASHFVVTRSA
jgi:dihydrofolate reductase